MWRRVCLSSTAASTSVVDDIVTFARQASKGEYDQVLDVLKTGIRSKPGSIGTSRLYLVEAELRANRGEWDNVVELCRQSASVASDMSPGSQEESRNRAEVELAACRLGTRALLIGHKDAEAFQTAQQCLDIARKSFSAVGSEDKRWQAMVLSTSVAGLVQHASCEFDSAGDSFENVMSLLESDNGARTALDHLIPEALKQAAAFFAAQGKKERAVSLGMRSIAAAEERLASNTLDPLLSPRVAEEVVGDAKVLMAQSCMYRKAWDDAEEKLNDSLSVVESVAEGSGNDQHPYLAMVLLLLAEVYCRTGRATLAEGLFREIMKILSVSTAGEGSKGTIAVHPSINSLASWRYSQLLSVLPKRETEARAWKDLATDIYEEAPLKRLTEPGDMFGSLDRLSGKGSGGQGVVLDLMTRRALPCTGDSKFA
ncbi:hypothetical protein M9434_001145 [Picochlorum sp. BPE23]|nr:hypothetical protein M9434_001145 [Picochlorum sp. BPE23]KAI8111888.1 hypothetical protein M9435_004386 [Picochlorum sp. BPE23]